MLFIHFWSIYDKLKFWLFQIFPRRNRVYNLTMTCAVRKDFQNEYFLSLASSFHIFAFNLYLKIFSLVFIQFFMFVSSKCQSWYILFIYFWGIYDKLKFWLFQIFPRQNRPYNCNVSCAVKEVFPSEARPKAELRSPEAELFSSLGNWVGNRKKVDKKKGTTTTTRPTFFAPPYFPCKF